MPQWMYAFIAIVWLAACGGGGSEGGDNGIDPRIERLATYEAQNLYVLGDLSGGTPGLPTTEASDVPEMGVMSFSGNATIRVEDGANPIAMFGDAEMAINFQDGVGEGRMSAFFGDNGLGEIVGFSGEIGLTSDRSDQDFPLAYSGTLSAQALTLVFDGTMEGIFVGDPVEGVVGVEFDADIVQNGQDQSGTIVMITTIAEAAPPP